MRRRITMWCAALMCLLLVAGCSSDSKPAESTGAATPAKPAMAALSGADIGAAMQKATAWHMTMKSPQAEMEMDVVCPDKMRTISKAGGMTAEMVRVGQTTYMKAGNKWMKVPAAGQQQQPICGATDAKMPALDATTKMTKGGTQVVNGETCTEWTITAADGKGGQSTTIMCVGSDNLPRQIKSGETVMIYSNWNKPAAIEEPKI